MIRFLKDLYKEYGSNAVALILIPFLAVFLYLIISLSFAIVF